MALIVYLLAGAYYLILILSITFYYKQRAKRKLDKGFNPFNLFPVIVLGFIGLAGYYAFNQNNPATIWDVAIPFYMFFVFVPVFCWVCVYHAIYGCDQYSKNKKIDAE